MVILHQLIFPLPNVLNKKTDKIYTPNGVLTTSSGARSAFMLPNIGCQTNHSALQRDFNIQDPAPKSHYEHWNIFRHITNSKIIDCNWRSCIIYFSNKWVDRLHNDSAWLQLKLYLHELAWSAFEYRRNQIYYDIAFSITQKKRNLKPNPYLVDTAKHIFTTAIGAAPGYVPAHNNNALPLDVIQNVYVESYGLRKYSPTIMQPSQFDFQNDKLPIYYSMQNPATCFSLQNLERFRVLWLR